MFDVHQKFRHGDTHSSDVAFITFQIVLKTIPIIKFYFVFKKIIIYISEV